MRETEGWHSESMVTLIVLHVVFITLFNVTQQQDGTPTPYNLICVLGTE